MDEVDDGYPDIPLDKFPYEPLENIAKAKHFGQSPDVPFSDRIFASIIDKPPRTVGRWREAGSIPWDSADVAAIALGLHPMSVWPERWLALDRGLIEGTDRKALREYDKALEQVGIALAAINA